MDALSWRRARLTGPGSVHVVPVVVVAVVGAWWIAAHASAGRGSTHTLFQVLALAENVLALLLRRRKPVGALASIVVIYVLVDLEPTTLLPLLIALCTVALVSNGNVVAVAAVATSVAVIGMPYLHGGSVPFPSYLLFHLATIGFAVTLGRYARIREEMADLRGGLDGPGDG